MDFCGAKCAGLGYSYFAMQYGEQCFCGNNFGKYGEANECNYACPGNEEEKNKCGGIWANSLYQINSGDRVLADTISS